MSVNIFCRLLALTLGLCLLCLAGCGTPPKVPPSGFLSNYDALTPDPDVEGLYWWEKKGVNWQNYHALLIDEVQVRMAPQAREQLEEGEAKQMAERLRSMVIKALAGNYPLASRPAPGVLRLRAALVHLKPVRPAVNVISSAVLMVPLDVGEAAVEAQFSDSVSGRVQGELVISNQGSIAQLTKVWTRWEQVEEAFAQWALLLRRAMMQGRPAPSE
ncbi:MAG: DUF3313 domain-containing protein [Desulfarculus sp.]|nr:DUF3313 domain-containing protein [Pseudomonadota bacterium]MBV1715463.1 DUF3313 domain-containing protein [Desulfarculus sp.]MBU4576231.1 DUF3313 domain-containing protein [Pseudomonadota bacterium]MBU4599269.1 DUF3313 domain-containing protein [Pseudomonadota bacterium]MBV1739690.1 DUF3313 domain-containing protein [Desulfarculus sp.]